MAGLLGFGAGSALQGLTIGGLHLRAPDIDGIALSVGYVRAEERMRGLVTGAFNRMEEEQQGISIGIINFAQELHGLQIGVLNIAANNPSGLKVLPILNFHP